jgi:hypothetical protein
MKNAKGGMAPDNQGAQDADSHKTLKATAAPVTVKRSTVSSTPAANKAYEGKSLVQVPGGVHENAAESVPNQAKPKNSKASPWAFPMATQRANKVNRSTVL